MNRRIITLQALLIKLEKVKYFRTLRKMSSSRFRIISEVSLYRVHSRLMSLHFPLLLTSLVNLYQNFIIKLMYLRYTFCRKCCISHTFVEINVRILFLD